MDQRHGTRARKLEESEALKHTYGGRKNDADSDKIET